MTSSDREDDRKTSRGLTAMWLAGAAAVTVISLGVSGTLSSWTSALITNSANDVATAGAVILKEIGPGTNPATCQSSDAGVSNSYTCATINKYGGTATPLSPGASQSVSVTLANVGTTSGALTLKAGSTCSSSGGISSGKTDACGIVQVKVDCSASSVVLPVTGNPVLPLTNTPVFPLTGVATLTDFSPTSSAAAIGTLAANTSMSCTFTVTLPATAAPSFAGQTLSQQLVWTLS